MPRSARLDGIGMQLVSSIPHRLKQCRLSSDNVRGGAGDSAASLPGPQPTCAAQLPIVDGLSYSPFELRDHDAAVVEVHADAKCLQVPMMAVARGCRQQGFGSMLFAIIGEVAEDLVR